MSTATRTASAKSTPLSMRWRASLLTHAPHRLGFFLAMLVLMTSAIWWALVQANRSFAWGVVPSTVPAMIVHSVVMCFGFLPLFFSGFLFTAGPKWLQVEGPEVRVIQMPLLLQAMGWLLWLAGGVVSQPLALLGCAVATFGLVWMCSLFWRMLLQSRAHDKIHASAIAAACLLGCVSLVAVVLSMVLGRLDLARAFVLTAIWGFIGVVYVVVAHRMIPFFTSSALPMLDAWRPFWVLWLLLAAMVLKVLEVWLTMIEWPVPFNMAWTALCGTLELVAGSALLWLAYRWGLVQSLKNHLLAMLHIGFSWIGIAFVLAGAVHWASLFTPVHGWELASLHAFTMGALGSLLLAMVTRVSCGHSGRLLHADGMVFGLFCLLQVAVLVRIAAALGGSWGAWGMASAALLWAVVVTLWGARLCTWYGKPRVDGRPG